MPPLVFPQQSTNDACDRIAGINIADQQLTLRLYSNARWPQVPDTILNYVEVSGGGYAAIPLAGANWTFTEGQPSVALYNAFQVFTFLGAPAPATIYGYYITNEDNLLVLVEQFYADQTPFLAFPGAILQIRPRFGADNLVAPPVIIPA